MSSRLGRMATGLAVAALAVPGTAAANGRGHHHDHGQTLRLVAKEVEFQYLDLAPSGFVGDQFVFSDDLYTNGRIVGDDGGQCAITRFQSYDEFDAHCVATLRLRGGQITVQGLITLSDGGGDRFTVAITGGTGRYRGASGEMRVRSVSDTKDIYTLRLDRR
jgi:allene oxide cyclase-like protein